MEVSGLRNRIDVRKSNSNKLLQDGTYTEKVGLQSGEDSSAVNSPQATDPPRLSRPPVSAAPSSTSHKIRCGFPLQVVLICAALLVAAALGSVFTLRCISTIDTVWHDEYIGQSLHYMGRYITVSVHKPPPDTQLIPNYEKINYDPNVEYEYGAQLPFSEHTEIVSCYPDQRLHEHEDNFMPDETFQAMKDCLVGHPKIAGNPLNPDGFSGTRGFVTKFSLDDGVDRFMNETKFNCGENFNPLVPFFKAARDPEANGFVMNVLVCDKPSNMDDLVVGRHVDSTLAHTVPNSYFLAHTVSVLYINVPSDMEGGDLEILGVGQDFDPDVAVAAIHPEENRMGRFRGDAHHQVRGYSTTTDQLRISLVLEQYKIEDEYLEFLVEYDEEEKSGMTMM